MAALLALCLSLVSREDETAAPEGYGLSYGYNYGGA